MKRLFLSNIQQLTSQQIRERRENIQFERTKYYANRLPADVYIKDRSGLLTLIKPKIGDSSFKPDGFYICEYLSCSPDLLASYDQQARNTPSSMRQYLHNAVLQHWNAEPPNRNRYALEAYTKVDFTTLKENEGVIYSEDHDLVIMTGLTMSQMEKIHHPYSMAGYAYNSFQQTREGNPYIRKGDFTFNIRIVDNEDRFGSKWLLIDDKPFCVIACKDEQVTDGIYVTYSENTLGGHGPQNLMVNRFDFKDSGNLPHYSLYDSRQEALMARRSVQVEEATARIRELEAKATATDNAFRKNAQEREYLEREAETRREKHEQDMKKFERERERLESEHKLFMQKQVAESIAIKRKNTTELIKCVPAILSTVAVALTLFKKKKG